MLAGQSLRRRRVLSLAALVVSAFAAQGCAAVGLTLFGAAAGTAAGAGTAYTLDGIAYRTFTASLDDMQRATALSLKRMDIPVETDEPTETGRHLVAQAGDRTIDIELHRMTPRATRMRVTAKYSVILRDRSTAGEIIAQTEIALNDLPLLTQDKATGKGGAQRGAPAKTK